MRAGCHVVQAGLWHANVIGFDALLHAGREEFMRGAHDAHAQCSAQWCIHGVTVVLGRGAGHRGRAGVTQHTFPLTAHQASPQMVRDGPVRVHACMVSCHAVD
jgi:hypothetical protein